MSKDFAEHANIIPGLQAASDEWQVYIDIVEINNLDEDIFIAQFLARIKNRLPRLSNLANAYIALPVSSVNVERSFSKYGSVLSPLPCSLTEENLKAYCAYFFKYVIECLLRNTCTVHLLIMDKYEIDPT